MTCVAARLGNPDGLFYPESHRYPPEPIVPTPRPALEHFTASTFDFITGGWFAKQIRASSAGTALDQLGWDMREMKLPLTYDHDHIQSIAEVWVSGRPPSGTGVPPSKVPVPSGRGQTG